MTRRIVLLLSGPNLNLLGEREPEIYGTATLDDHVAAARAVAETHDLELEHLQSNHEGELVDAVHGARGRCAAIVINAGALTHYGRSLQDALAAFDGPDRRAAPLQPGRARGVASHLGDRAGRHGDHRRPRRPRLPAWRSRRSRGCSA